MTTHHFGTDQNPAHYVEIDDGVSNPPRRPTADEITAGLVLQCRDASDLSALPDVTIEARTGYFDFTTEDVPIVQVSADGTTWIPLQSTEALADAVVAGATANAAQVTANTALDQITDLIATIGVPGGLAQLGPDGTLAALQAAGISPVVQNSDGTWDPRPATTRPVFWWRIIGGSTTPATNGTTAGGAGMVDSFDVIVDLAADLGT